VPGLPPLLFRQIGVLALTAGVLACRYPVCGIACVVVLLVGLGRVPWPRLFFLILIFILGWCYGWADAPPRSVSAPSWFDPTQRQRVSGTVEEVSGQPDRRLRVILEKVSPLTETEAKPIPGKVSLAWDQATRPDSPRPLPGQTITLTSRIRPITGFANEGVSNISAWWAARHVWFSAWTSTSLPPERSDIIVTGEPDPLPALRERWRALMVEELGGSSLGKGGFYRQGTSAPKALSRKEDRAIQARAMLPALLFGDRYGLDTATLDLFTRAGLVHSLALSGQHLALAGMAAALLIWLAGRGKPSLFLIMPRRSLLLILGVPLAALYLWLGSAPLSLIRASLMILFSFLFSLGKRPAVLYDLLFLTVLCFLLVWPQSVFEISIQLSVLSVTGIALALPLLERVRRLPGSSPISRLGKGLLFLLITSVAVQVTTLPVVLHSFGRISPLFALNLIWLPVLEMLILPLTAVGFLLLILFGPQMVSDGLFTVAALPAEVMIFLLQSLRDHGLLTVWQGLKPSGLSVVGYAAAIAAAACRLVVSRRPRERAETAAKRLLFCALLLLPAGTVERHMDALVAHVQGRVSLRMLDVGQGQALVVEWPGGRLLLDGGGSSSPRFDPGRDVVAHALTANRPPHLDWVLVSHADLDHARGLVAILETFVVEAFGRSALPFEAESDGARLEGMRGRQGIALHEFQTGDKLELGGGLTLEVIHPPAQGRFSSNNGSLILRLTRHGHGLALMCGDAQHAALRRVLRSGADIRAEVLVIPHHGSATSLEPEFYRAVRPDFAFISCGAYNSFRFPRPEVIRALRDQGITILTTATDGAVRVDWYRDGSRSISRARTQESGTNPRTRAFSF